MAFKLGYALRKVRRLCRLRGSAVREEPDEVESFLSDLEADVGEAIP